MTTRRFKKEAGRVAPGRTTAKGVFVSAIGYYGSTLPTGPPTGIFPHPTPTFATQTTTGASPMTIDFLLILVILALPVLLFVWAVYEEITRRVLGRPHRYRPRHRWD